jgi:hypothetical protein
MYIKNIFLYFLIILVYLSLYYKLNSKNFYIINNNIKIFRYKILKDFWKFKLYANNINWVKLNYFKKW